MSAPNHSASGLSGRARPRYTGERDPSERGLSGRSSVVPAFSVDHGGNVSLGVNAEYQKLWKFGMTYVHFTGSTKPVTVGDARAPSGLAYSFGQSLADRNFFAISAQRTF